MTTSTGQKTNAARSKRADTGKKPAKRISDWLAFIRPHLDSYTALQRGEQKKFITTLSETTGSSINTLRRYIAGAQFLESHSIREFPRGLARMPIASVEAIARINRRDPREARWLLEGLSRGSWTIQALNDKLNELPDKPRRAESHMRVTLAQLQAEVAKFVSHETRRKVTAARVRVVEFESAAAAAAFDRLAFPRLVLLLPEDIRVAVFDESSIVWHVSAHRPGREFVRNIAVALSLFDFVVVLCTELQPEVERLTAEMREHSRTRVMTRRGILDI
jgi:hypothetical protein